jgi:benzoyl-CoA reductase/2-hydroxyglutaryl-CoA dehydratase subunit BcrC/BadD/HgdB
LNDSAAVANPRQQRLLTRIHREVSAEFEAGRLQLQQRPDYHPVWEYFLDLLMRPLVPGMLQEVGRPLVEHLCNQAPYELYHAMGVHPVRLGSGCFSVARLSASRSPVLMCPLLKATMGMLQLQAPSRSEAIPRVVPTTCDWVVKFPEMTDDHTSPTCFLELPHLRQSERGQSRWLEEMYELVRFLEVQTGRKLKRRALLSSVQTFMQAWDAFGQLIELRRTGRLAGVWFMVAANSFMLDRIETWTEEVQRVIELIKTQAPVSIGKGVFLAGSPIIFPNFKLPNLIEAAGMTILGDDLCTSERIWPGAVCYEDTSFHGLMRALAERYHKACSCPTFADNDRRINSIFNFLEQHPIQGVIYHVLKGCHPFDIENFNIERQLNRLGHRFIKIETDYVQEDSQNILTRLEAFGQIDNGKIGISHAR